MSQIIQIKPNNSQRDLTTDMQKLLQTNTLTISLCTLKLDFCNIANKISQNKSD